MREVEDNDCNGKCYLSNQIQKETSDESNSENAVPVSIKRIEFPHLQYKIDFSNFNSVMQIAFLNENNYPLETYIDSPTPPPKFSHSFS